MKNELDITKIMDDYTDNEFGIEGEQTVDTEKAVADLLAQVKTKKKMKPLFKIIAAAAAAVVLAVTAAAATLIISGSFTSHAGGNVEYEVYEDGWMMSYTPGEEIPPIKVEENRLYLTAEGQELDITDLVDDVTPYIYTCKEAVGDKEDYIIIGGTPEKCGYYEMYYVNGIGWQGHSGFLQDLGYNIHVFDLREYTENPDPETRTNYAWIHGSSGTYFTDELPDVWRTDEITQGDVWLLEALQQLGLLKLP